MIFKIEARTKQFNYFADKDAVNLNFIEGFFRVSNKVREYLMNSTGKKFSPGDRFSLEIECKSGKDEVIGGVMNGTINGTIINIVKI